MDRSMRNLWTWTIAQGLSRFGDHFQFLAVTAVTYAATRSALYTAVQMAVSHLPGLLWARWTGRLADRYSPRTITFVLNLLRAGMTLAYIGRTHVAVLLTLNFLASTLGAFAAPARVALLPGLVGRDRLLRANARQATIMGAVELLGPGIAGWTLLRLGAAWAYGFNAISFLIPAVAMLLVRPVVAEVAAKGGPARWAAPEGATVSVPGFLRSRRDLLAVLLANGAFLLGMWAVNAMFFPYASEILHRGTDVMGWSISAYYGASLVSGLILERWGHRFRTGGLLLGAYGFGTVVWLGYSVVRSVSLMLGLSALDGTVYTLASTLVETRIQEEAPPDMVGRVSATVGAMEKVSTISGQLLGGWLAVTWGVLAGFRVAALLSLGLLGVVIAFARAVLFSRRVQAPGAGNH